jgi:tetratricopeptide (TPR) repeat protein
MRRIVSLLIAILLFAAPLVAAGLPAQPNDREWSALSAEYLRIDALRKAQPLPPANASRKQMLELVLDNQKKLEPVYVPFLDKVKEYFDRTHDPRAGQVLAREKIIMGDEYMQYLSRYDKALDLYRAAVDLDPSSIDAKQRVTLAEKRRFVAMTAFANVRSGMKEDTVRNLVGLPREDWIKQVVQNGRVYSVWIYPKEDGGASAIYFDNGTVYHTNWNAAAPPAPQAQTK